MTDQPTNVQRLINELPKDGSSIRSSQLSAKTGIPLNSINTLLKPKISTGQVTACKVTSPDTKRETYEWRLGAGVAPKTALTEYVPPKPPPRRDAKTPTVSNDGLRPAVTPEPAPSPELMPVADASKAAPVHKFEPLRTVVKVRDLEPKIDDFLSQNEVDTLLKGVTAPTAPPALNEQVFYAVALQSDLHTSKESALAAALADMGDFVEQGLILVKVTPVCRLKLGLVPVEG